LESETPESGPRTFEFRTDVGPATQMATVPVTLTETNITTTVSDPTATAAPELTVGLSTSQPTADSSFSVTRLAWTRPHNTTRQQEREMAMKIRRALEMSSASEMMGDQDIPLDPGLTDVAYQPHGQSKET